MIDEHALAALEFEKIRNRVATYTISPLGRERMMTLSPSGDVEKIRRDLRKVSEFRDLLAYDDPVPIRGIRDIRSALRKCRTQGAFLDPEDLLHIQETLSVIRLLGAYLKKRRKQYPLLGDLAEGLGAHQELEERIEGAIDPNGTVRDSASKTLIRIRRDIGRARDNLKRKLEAILENLPSEVVQDRLVTLRDGRFVIPVRENQRRRVEGVVHDQSDSGATVFIEPLVVVEYNNLIRELEISEKREIERILRELTDYVREAREDLLGNIDLLGQFDFIYAKARFALEIEAIEPILNEAGRIVIRRGRHPILAYRLREEGQDGKVVPLDVELGLRFNTLILTGPNAGGKTVALKTIGLLTLMAQAGLPIPADEKSEIAVFQKVFADIGDEQSIENDLSTFSSHVRQLVKICREADDRTLALLDEIGTSTDPSEGAALAMAVLNRLNRADVRTVATTHHGGLKGFAHEIPGMENGAMEFDVTTLQPTFRLHLGTPGSSYAFEIAQRLGLPLEVIEDASARTGEETRKLEKLISELDQRRQEYEEKLQHLDRRRTETAAMSQEYEEKLRAVRAEKEQFRKEALEESKRILEEANARVERAVAQIRQQQARGKAIKEGKTAIRHALTDVETELRSMAPPRCSKAPEVQTGDRVWIQSFGREGTVLSLRGPSGRVQVQVGSVKVELSPTELKVLEKAEPKKKEFTSVLSGKSASLSPEIHLRGMTFDEASQVVDKYLDDAFLANLKTVTVIHGKGTGVLRRKIGEFLQSHTMVKSQRLGAWNEGGSGVTIVEMKDT